eukprot:TRINITY_DN2658_c0_g1_i4.p1 TRINITY_DN2658_c0_g1~~TRINITY_DN2658_c0_g1_i4.p1  ORF type:complete len:3811 (+),score=698.07 TRINITY_DN2658_c0_g1_i4:295-11727(+)
MGNSESTSSVDQLKATLGRDNGLYALLSPLSNAGGTRGGGAVGEARLFDDDFLTAKFLQELENATQRYKEDDEAFKREERLVERGRNIALALGAVGGIGTESSGGDAFQEKQLKWIKQEVYRLSHTPTPMFLSMLEKRLQLIRHIHAAVNRYHLRLRYKSQGAPAPPPPPPHGVAGARSAFASNLGLALRARLSTSQTTPPASTTDTPQTPQSPAASITTTPTPTPAPSSTTSVPTSPPVTTTTVLSEEAPTPATTSNEASAVPLQQPKPEPKLDPLDTIESILVALFKDTLDEALLERLLLPRFAELPSVDHLVYSEQQDSAFDWSQGAPTAPTNTEEEGTPSTGPEGDTAQTTTATTSKDQAKPAAISERPFEESLLAVLTTYVFDADERALEALLSPPAEQPAATTATTPSKSEPAVISSRPSVVLLQILQRELLREAGSVEECHALTQNKTSKLSPETTAAMLASAEKALETLGLYASQILERSSRLLEQAQTVNTQLLARESAAGETMNAKLKQRVEESVLLTITRPLVTTLCLVIEQSRAYDLLSVLLPSLVKLLRTVDVFNAANAEASIAEDVYLEKENNKNALQYVERIKVETPHNYYPNTDEEQVVTIPGCTHLCITFDERCSLEKDADFLQLYRGPGKQEALFSAFTGPSAQWPKIPLIVDGDTVVFHFTSNPFNTFWGYRCIVTGLRMESSLVPLWDLEKTIAYFTSKCIGGLCVGQRIPTVERGYAQWLDSELFQGGLDQSSAEAPKASDKGKERQDKPKDAGAQFLEDIVQQVEGSAGISFYNTQRKKRPDVFDNYGGPVLDATVRLFVAAALRHLGLIEAALKPGGEDGSRSQMEERKLDAIVAESKAMRKWVVQEHQRIANELSEKKKEQEAEAELKAAKEGESDSAPAKGSEAAEPQKEEVDVSSYEYLSEVMNTKLQLLFQVTPAYSVLQQPYSPLPLRAGTALSPTEDILLQLLVSYCKETPVKSPLSVIKRREECTRGRIGAFQSLESLLREIRFNSVRQDLLRALGPALRSIRSAVPPPASSTTTTATVNTTTTSTTPQRRPRQRVIAGAHYLCNTGASGIALQQSLRVAFKTLYSFLAEDVAKAVSSGSQNALSGLIVDAFTLDYTVADHDYLLSTNVMDVFHQMMDVSQAGELNDSNGDDDDGVRVITELPPADEKKDKGKERNTLTSSSTRAATLSSVSFRRQVRRKERLLGRLAFAFVATRCVAKPIGGVPSADSSALRNYILEIITSDLEKCTTVLLKQRRLLGTRDGPRSERHSWGTRGKGNNRRARVPVDDSEDEETLAYHRNVRSCYSLLVLFNSVTLNPASESFLISPRVLRLLLFTHYAGTPQLQRGALRILRRVLPRLSTETLASPTVLDFWTGHDNTVEEDFSLPGLGAWQSVPPVLRYLFQYLGQKLIVEYESEDTIESARRKRSSLTASKVISVSHNWRDGQIVFADCSEVLMLLRSLLKTSPVWTNQLVAAMTSVLQVIPTLINPQTARMITSTPDNLPQRNHLLRYVLSSLCVMGGHTDSLRVGGRVEVKATRETGVLIYYDRRSSKVKLILDSNTNKVIDCDLSKVDALTEVSIDLDLVPISTDILKALLVFISDAPPPPTPSLNEQEEKVQAEEEEVSEVAPIAPEPSVLDEPQAWACEVCTLINDASAFSCGVCDSPRPASTIPEKPQPPAPTPKMPEQKEEDEEEDAAPALPFADGDVLYQQLRSRSIKALCNIVQCPKAMALIAESKVLSILLSTAVRPTNLEEFTSLAQLEQREARILELLYQNQVGIEEESGPQHQSQTEFLEHNPFKGQPVSLPSTFDRATARNLAFVQDSLLGVVGRTTDRELERVGIVRGNAVIPNSLPAFYFEIRLAPATPEDDSGFVEPKKTAEKKATTPVVTSAPKVESTDSSAAPSTPAAPATPTSEAEDDGAIPEGALSVAIGLFRDGIPLQGVPGEHNSYAYSSERGRVFHNVSNLRQSQQLKTEYGPNFQVGDVVGCRWDIRNKRIFFTKNGETLGPAFDSVSGRFVPVVWVRSNHVRVEVNFGHEPFVYDFVSTLPEGYLAGMEDIESKAKVMSIQEIRRRTVAEELMMMMEVFPLELCVVALERSRDDMQYAANWLLERGYQELDKWTKEMIAISKRQEEDRLKQSRGAKKSSKNSSQTVQENTSRTEGNNRSDDADDDVDDEDDEFDQEEEDDGLSAYDEDYNREASRYLDDEIGADVPVQIERREKVIEGMKVEDLCIGMQLCVSPNATEKYATVMNTVGRTGVVSSIDLNEMRVRVRFINSETASKHSFWFYFYELEKPDRMWQDPCMDLLASGDSFSKDGSAKKQKQKKDDDDEDDDVMPRLINGLVTASNALLVLTVRRCVLALLARWPDLDLHELGGSKYVIELLKLAASEHLSSKSKREQQLTQQSASTSETDSGQPLTVGNAGVGTAVSTDGGSFVVVGDKIDVLASFRAKLTMLLKKQQLSFSIDMPISPLNIPAYNTARSKQGQGGESLETSTTATTVPIAFDDKDTSIAKLLTEECILHFVQAVSVPPPVIVEESEHNYQSNQDYRKRFHISGASRLIIRFDPRCQTGTDMLTRVAFYRDDQYQDPIAVNRGRVQAGGSGGSQFQTLIVPGDTVYFRFTSGPTNTYWGFKFSVSPLEWRLNDVQALKGLNFELGYWFLELLLEEGPAFVKDVYIVDLYDALVWYIRAAKRSAKGRGIQLLLRVLREIRSHSLAARRVNLNKILTLRSKMDAMYSKEVAGAGASTQQQLHSSHLQSLVELVAVARLVGDEISRDTTPLTIAPASEKGKERRDDGGPATPIVVDRQVPMIDVGVAQLRVTKAVYGVLENKRQRVDITPQIQELVSTYGGSYLYLPHDHQTSMTIFAHAFGAPSAPASASSSKQSSPAVILSTSQTAVAVPTFAQAPRRSGGLFGDDDGSSSDSEGEDTSLSAPGTEPDITPSLRRPLVRRSSIGLSSSSGGFAASLSLSRSGGGSDEPASTPSAGKEPTKRLRLYYEIVDKVTGVVLENSWQKLVGAGEALVLRAEASWFNNVVSVADMVQGLLRKNSTFPRRVLTDAYRLDCIRRHFVPLIGEEVVEIGPDKGRVLCDGGGIGVGAGASWTLSTWIFVTEEPTSHQRTIFYKGLDLDTTRQCLFLNANDKKLVFSVSTEGEWREACVTNKEIPSKTWTNITCRCDARARTIAIFIDGDLDVEHTLSSELKPNNNPLYIGKMPDKVMNNSFGAGTLLKDMRLYIRPLSAEEINEVYSSVRCNIFLRMEKDMRFPKSVPVVPKIKLSELEAFLQRVEAESWSLDRLFQLTEMLSVHCEETKQNPLLLDVDAIAPKEEELQRYPSLRGLSLEDIRFRFNVIRLLNRQLAVVIPLVDFSQAHLSWTLAHSISKLTPLVFLETKLNLWNKIMDSTMARTSRVSISINRPRALRAKERGDPEGSRSVFGQAFRQMHFMKPEALRISGQTWRVTYEGEGGTDAGGLFRDSISHICNDLQSPYVPLFIPCPNSKGFGENQDKWIPNPLSTTSLCLSMYAFVGKLMGVAIRGKHMLNLDLPSIVWKQLVGAELTIHDLEGIDRHCVQFLNETAALRDEDEDKWPFYDHTWCYTSADGRTTVDLRPGGRELPVKWEEREEFRSAVLAYRLNEFRVQTEHIRKGMATIVPVHLLSLFTWHELQLNVCGRGDIDIGFLRENTRYQSGFSASDAHVLMLWEVLAGFTRAQRQMFLRFVWGRSRLPLSSADFQQKFVILGCRHNTDGTLPISHTCFFQLELPRYSVAAVMREKMLYAVSECTAIDGDFRPQDVDWEAED